MPRQLLLLRWGFLQVGDVGVEGNSTANLMATPDQARRSPGCLHPAPPKANHPELIRLRNRHRLAPGGCSGGLPPARHCGRQFECDTTSGRFQSSQSKCTSSPSTKSGNQRECPPTWSTCWCGRRITVGPLDQPGARRCSVHRGTSAGNRTLPSPGLSKSADSSVHKPNRSRGS